MLLRIFNFFFFFYYVYFKWKNKSQDLKEKSIVFFNTHDKGGGAAKICYQLFDYVKPSQMFVLTKRTNNNNIYSFDPILWNRVGQISKIIENKYGILDYSKLGILNLVKNASYTNSHIIHLHNTHGYYMSFLAMGQMFKKKKIVWTLHDDYLLTGHCSFSMKCNKWVLGCNNCPDLGIYPPLKDDTTSLNQKEKKSFLIKIQPYIVTPSKWLEKRVRTRYPFLKNVQTIYNGIDTEIFYPILEKKSIRSKYNIPKDAFIILFVAELSTNNPFKGGDIINSLLRNGLPKNWFILTIGDTEVKTTFDNHIVFPYITEDSQLNELYNLSDVMLYPTKADNLPLVVLESMSSGIPVIASNIGGINEIITDGKDGFLIEDSEIESYLIKLTEFFHFTIDKKNLFSIEARNKIVEKFDEKIMLESYKKLYSNLIK